MYSKPWWHYSSKLDCLPSQIILFARGSDGGDVTVMCDTVWYDEETPGQFWVVPMTSLSTTASADSDDTATMTSLKVSRSRLHVAPPSFDSHVTVGYDELSEKRSSGNTLFRHHQLQNDIKVV